MSNKTKLKKFLRLLNFLLVSWNKIIFNFIVFKKKKKKRKKALAIGEIIQRHRHTHTGASEKETHKDPPIKASKMDDRETELV